MNFRRSRRGVARGAGLSAFPTKVRLSLRRRRKRAPWPKSMFCSRPSAKEGRPQRVASVAASSSHVPQRQDQCVETASVVSQQDCTYPQMISTTQFRRVVGVRQSKSLSPKSNTWNLYWVESDGIEDCFVVARNSRSACRVEIDENGFDRRGRSSHQDYAYFARRSGLV